MRLLWHAGLATGVRQIDLQHQELIDLINELESAYETGQDAQALIDVLPRLSAYAMFHFGTEEGLMEQAAKGTPLEQAHLGEHQLFADKLTLMKNEVDATPRQTVGKLLDYLKSWLQAHIMKTDKELAKVILSRTR